MIKKFQSYNHNMIQGDPLAVIPLSTQIICPVIYEEARKYKNIIVAETSLDSPMCFIEARLIKHLNVFCS